MVNPLKIIFPWFFERTRLGTQVDLATHVAPNIIVCIEARRDLKHEKHEEQKMKANAQQEQAADNEVDLDKVKGSLDSFFVHGFRAYRNLDEADEGVFVMEYRALKILKKFHDGFNKFVGSGKLNDLTKAKLVEIAAKYKALTNKLEPQLEEMDQRIRRERAGRHLVRDISVNQWVAIYFQMRHRCSHLRRMSSKLNSEEHRILHELDGLLKDPSDRNAQKIVNEFSAKFAPALDAVVADAIFVEHMITRLRLRLDDYTAQEQQQMQKLLSEGFPKETIDEINKELVTKLEQERKSDILREYEEARAMVNIMHQSEELALAA